MKDLTLAKKAGRQNGALLCRQIEAGQRESLDLLLASVDQDQEVSETLRKAVRALLEERYRSIQIPWTVPGCTYILSGNIFLSDAPLIYEQMEKERVVCQESRLTYGLEDHPKYGYPHLRLNLEVARQTDLDVTDNGSVCSAWIKRGENLFRQIGHNQTEIEIDPTKPATIEQMIKLIQPVYKKPKLSSRVIREIERTREAIAGIVENNYSCEGRNPHLSPAPQELTERIFSTLRELDQIPLYETVPIPESVEQEIAVAVCAINSIVKYYESCGFPMVLKGGFAF